MRQFLIILITVTILFPQVSITFDSLPENYQLFPRDGSNQAVINISGSIDSTGYDTMYVDLLREDEIYTRDTLALVYVDSVADFQHSIIINAELSEYSIDIYVNSILVAERDNLVCGDVYLINGQSNAVAEDFDGKATFQSRWIRSYGSSSLLAVECEADTSWGLAQGTNIYSHMAIGIWGLELGKNISEQYGIPVGIINGAVKGTPIEHHYRSHANPANLNSIYGRLLYRAQKADVINAVKAIFWYQGESDTDPSYQSYISDFGNVLWAWHQDFPSLERIYVFQISPSQADCGFGYQSQLREKQRQLAANYSEVSLMSTSGIEGHYNDGCHYSYEGYKNIANWILPLVARHYYGSSVKNGIKPPNIINAYQSGGTQNEITLIFDQPIVWPDPYQGHKMEDYFYIGGQTGIVESGYAESNNKLILELNSPPPAAYVTYLPEDNYNGTNQYYQGPWVKNSKGIGALSFYKFPMGLYSPPVSSDDEITAFEDSSYIFQNGDISFSDADGQKFNGIIIEDLPAKGTLTYYNEAVEAGQHCEELDALTFIANQDEYGDVYTTFTFRVVDGSGAYSENAYTMTIHVTELNDPPTFDSNLAYNVMEDSGEFEIVLQGINEGPDPDTQEITITARSLDLSAFPDPVVEYDYPDQTARLVSTLSSNVFGEFPIEIVLRDDGGTENNGVDSLVATIYLSVTGVNDPPVFNTLADVNIMEDSGTLVLQITGLDPGIYEEDQQINLSASSNDKDIMPDPQFNYDGFSNAAEIMLESAENANGAVTITVTAKDNGGTVNGGEDSFTQSFLVEIEPVNDGPNVFSLLEPLEEINLKISKNNLQDTLTFSWEGADDPDGDEVSYSFLATGDLVNLSRENILSEELKLSYSDIITSTDTLEVATGSWTIIATDMVQNTSAVNGPFMLSVDGRSLLSGKFGLDQNFPNPFNSKTRIGYDLPAREYVKLTIYNLLGREVKTLVDETQSKGYKSVIWDGANNFNEEVAAGIYLYIIEAGDNVAAKKLVYIK
jgi:hypothetical protein